MWQLFGTFWPALGMVLVFSVALFWKRIRWYALFFGPLIVLVPCFRFADSWGANGNLLFMVLYLGLMAGLTFYYPVLTIVGAIVFYRRSRARQGK